MKHQVVPQRDRNSSEDDERINQIAMMLQNPSPNFQKGFEFTRSESFNQFSSLFSPTITSDTLGFGNTPNQNQVQPSPFVVSTNPAAFLGSMVPGTPIQGTNPNISTDVTPPVSSVTSSTSAPVHDVKKIRIDVDPKNIPESEESDREHDPEHEEDADEEYHDQDSAEDNVPSGEEGEEEEESDASYQKEHGAKRRKRKAAQPISTNARCFADLTDDDIAFMDFKDLTRMMTAAGLSRQEIAETKARRRRLKNRQSARLCSNKKREMCQELATEKSKLQDQMNLLQQQYTRLQRDHSALKQQYEALLRQTR